MTEITAESANQLRATYFTPEQAKDFLAQYLTQIDTSKLPEQVKEGIDAINALPPAEKNQFIENAIMQASVIRHSKNTGLANDDKTINFSYLMGGLSGAAEKNSSNLDGSIAISNVNVTGFFQAVAMEKENLDMEGLKPALEAGIEIVGANIGRTDEQAKNPPPPVNNPEIIAPEAEANGGEAINQEVIASNIDNLLFPKSELETAMQTHINALIESGNVDIHALAQQNLEAVTPAEGTQATAEQQAAIETYTNIISQMAGKSREDQLNIYQKAKIGGFEITNLMGTAIAENLSDNLPSVDGNITIGMAQNSLITWAASADNKELAEILGITKSNSFEGSRFTYFQDTKDSPNNITNTLEDGLTKYRGTPNYTLLENIGINLAEPQIATEEQLTELNKAQPQIKITHEQAIASAAITSNPNGNAPVTPAEDQEKEGINFGLAFIAAIVAAISGGSKRNNPQEHEMEAMNIGVNMPGVMLSNTPNVVNSGNVPDLSLTGITGGQEVTKIPESALGIRREASPSNSRPV